MENGPEFESDLKSSLAAAPEKSTKDYYAIDLHEPQTQLVIVYKKNYVLPATRSGCCDRYRFLFFVVVFFLKFGGSKTEKKQIKTITQLATAARKESETDPFEMR